MSGFEELSKPVGLSEKQVNLTKELFKVLEEHEFKSSGQPVAFVFENGGIHFINKWDTLGSAIEGKAVGKIHKVIDPNVASVVMSITSNHRAKDVLDQIETLKVLAMVNEVSRESWEMGMPW